MNSYDRWFRWSFNIFIFLMCVQLGLLITLKSVYMKAEREAKKNQAKVNFQCGEFNRESNYWSLDRNRFSVLPGCLSADCPESLWVGETQQDTDLHVLAVKKARPSQWKDGKVDYGHFVEVNLKKTERPMVLVLVSQDLMQWNFKVETAHNSFKKNVEEEMKSKDMTLGRLDTFIEPENWQMGQGLNLKEVIVVGPELVWIDGLNKDVKVTYFNKDQLCAYPTAWEEIANPENQFRRLYAALKEYTGLDVTTFQGKTVGREFRVPFRSLLAEARQQDSQRQLASDRSSTSADGLGLQWQRQGKNLVATGFKYRRDGEVHELTVPKQTTQAFYEYAKSKLYLIKNHQFGTWDQDHKKFQAIHLPLKMPAMYWPTSMTFNSLTSEIFIYNDDRGGEIFAYNVVTGKWRQFAEKVGYSLLAIHYDTDKRKLIGARYRGQKIESLVQFDRKGKAKEVQQLTQPVDFSKTLWRLQLNRHRDRLWLKVAHPAHPGGDLYPLQELKTL